MIEIMPVQERNFKNTKKKKKVNSTLWVYDTKKRG